MNIDSMNNPTISINQSSDEQYPCVNNHQEEISTQNDINLEEIIEGINKVKKTPKTPTPLYIFFLLLNYHNL